MNISLIGGGVMAEAIVNGILGQRITQAKDIWIGEPVESRRKDLSSRYGIATTRVNREAAQHGDLVILAVKPQQLDEILDDLHETGVPVTRGRLATLLDAIHGDPDAYQNLPPEWQELTH